MFFSMFPRGADINQEPPLLARVRYLKSFHGFGLMALNRYVMDLLNEVLNIDLGLEAAKTQEVKVGGQKK